MGFIKVCFWRKLYYSLREFCFMVYGNCYYIVDKVDEISLIYVKDKIFLWFKLLLILLNVIVIKVCD